MKKKSMYLVTAILLASLVTACAGQSGSTAAVGQSAAEAVDEAAGLTEEENGEAAGAENAAEETAAAETDASAENEQGPDAGAADGAAEGEGISDDSGEDAGESNVEGETVLTAETSGEKSAETEGAAEGKTEEAEDGIELSAEPAVTGERKRRELPHQEIVEQEKIESVTAFTDTTKRPDSIDGPSVMFIENKKVTEPKLKWKDDSFPDSEEDVQIILADLMRYWDSYNMDAVDYLVRMEKYRYLSQLLSGTNEYFYCGDVNKEGEPEGKGIAVYAGNQYYFGNFKDGLRSGEGTWYQIFERGGAYCKANYGIYLHSYAGQWENDLPNGSGQEHISLDQEYLTKRICTNVIGTFKDGYYDGEEIVTSLDENNNFINWKGTAVKGAWAPVSATLIRNAEGETEFAALQSYDNPDDYFWMLQSENSGQGITGLVPVN